MPYQDLTNVDSDPVTFAAADEKFSADDVAYRIINQLGGDVSQKHTLMPHLLGVLRGRSKQTFSRDEVDSLAGFLGAHPQLGIGRTPAADVQEYRRLLEKTPIGQLLLEQQKGNAT